VLCEVGLPQEHELQVHEDSSQWFVSLQGFLGREGAAADHAGSFKVIARVFRLG
jgi:hypothetical protein